MFIPHLWLAVFIFSTKLSSFATAPKARIFFYYYAMYSFFREGINEISRLPFAVNAILKISLISPSHGQTNKCEIPLQIIWCRYSIFWFWCHRFWLRHIHPSTRWCHYSNFRWWWCHRFWWRQPEIMTSSPLHFIYEMKTIAYDTIDFNLLHRKKTEANGAFHTTDDMTNVFFLVFPYTRLFFVNMSSLSFTVGK